MRKFTTPAQSDAARANGAKSHGPATPAGRARSSQNSRRHGLSIHSATHTLPFASIVLPTESLDEFHAILNSYLADLAPAGPVEIELVAAMVAARWRLRRIATIETTFLGNEIERLAPYADKSFAAMHRIPTSDDRLAHAFNTIGNGASLNLLIRYEGTLSRSYARAFKQFQLLRSLRVRTQPNEPRVCRQRTGPKSLPLEPPALVPVPVLQTPPQSHKIHDELRQIPIPALEIPGLAAPTCDNGGSPRINDQHLHS